MGTSTEIVLNRYICIKGTNVSNLVDFNSALVMFCVWYENECQTNQKFFIVL